MIIIINGSRNAGKSTISKLLARKLPKTANIEIDSLRGFIRFLNLEKSIPINLENAVLVANNFVSKKYTVILNYCLRKEDYRYLASHLSKAAKLYTFTLRPTLQTALSRRGNITALSADDKKRIREQYNPKSKNFCPPLGVMIDNTSIEPQKVVTQILKAIKK